MTAFCNCNPACLSIDCCLDFWISTHEPLWVSLKRRFYRVASNVSAPACEDLTPQHDGFLQVLSQVSNHLGLLNFHQPEVDLLPHQVLRFRCFLTEVYPNTSQSSGGKQTKVIQHADHCFVGQRGRWFKQWPSMLADCFVGRGGGKI